MKSLADFGFLHRRRGSACQLILRKFTLIGSRFASWLGFRVTPGIADGRRLIDIHLMSHVTLDLDHGWLSARGS